METLAILLSPWARVEGAPVRCVCWTAILFFFVLFNFILFILFLTRHIDILILLYIVSDSLYCTLLLLHC